MLDQIIRVLLLEDEAADAALVAQMLRRARPGGFRLTVVTRLQDCLDRLRDEEFDVVLADLGLPDSVGIATLDSLTRAAPRLPVVVLTGNDDEAVALAVVKRGAQDYLVKRIGDGIILPRVIRYAIERKAAEQALRQARDTAEQAARAKTVFLAMMGHEIRTPLNGVLGMARLLMETELDQRQRAHVDVLVSSGELLLGLVNDVLDFARIEADGMSLEPEDFDVLDTVEEVRLVLAGRAADKGLDLSSTFDAAITRWVRGDRLRLRQILFNLVGNAIKFTDRGRVVMSARMLDDRTGGQWLRFSVSDTGIGIPPQVGDKLFREFWQGDSGPSRRFAGAGLGLAICQRLCTLMGGSIGYDSEPGRGSLFWADLPFPAAARPAGPHSDRFHPPPPQRILVVDDNDVNREVGAGLLQRRGHQVATAEDGMAAIAAAREGGFDLILLDVRMPGMDGFEVARQIRALPGAAGAVPIVLLTANPLGLDLDSWRALGIRACLSKPFRVDDLVPYLDAGGAACPSPLVALNDLGHDICDLGSERMAGLAKLFRRSSGADLRRILELAGDGASLAEVGTTAHRMAGAASSLHLRQLADRCREIDAAAGRHDVAEVKARLIGIESLWQRSLDALTAALEREGVGGLSGLSQQDLF